MHRLKNRQHGINFLVNVIEARKKKMRRLKLGKVVFEFKKIIYAEITIHEGVEMRYIRQDTTDEDNLKIENRLKALGWRWDLKNIIALLVVIFLACTLLSAAIYVWYCNNLPSIAYRDEDLDEMLRRSLQLVLAGPSTSIIKFLMCLNYMLAGMIADCCIELNVIF